MVAGLRAGQSIATELEAFNSDDLTLPSYGGAGHITAVDEDTHTGDAASDDPDHEWEEVPDDDAAEDGYAEDTEDEAEDEDDWDDDADDDSDLAEEDSDTEAWDADDDEADNDDADDDDADDDDDDWDDDDDDDWDDDDEDAE